MENDIFPPRSPGDGSGTFCPNGGRTTRGAAGGPSAWTALDVGTAGLVETTVGRLDDAQRHLREARDLGKQFDDTGWPPGPGCCWAPWLWCGAG